MFFELLSHYVTAPLYLKAEHLKLLFVAIMFLFVAISLIINRIKSAPLFQRGAPRSGEELRIIFFINFPASF